MTIIQKGKNKLIACCKPVMVCMTSFMLSTAIFANPVLNNVSSGQVSVSQTPTTTTVNQSSQKAILNWDSFNIGSSETTHFEQPAGGVALNRINPTQGASQIFGRLTATGQIILVNPAGIFFAPGSYVNVGGLIASTANISDSDFLNGRYYFYKDGNYNGAVINQGQIIAANNGLVALIGGAVSNSGLISAQVGHVALGAGDAFTLTFDGNNLVSFQVNEGVTTRAHDQNGNEMTTGVSNTGTIMADDGHVLVSARDASNVLNNVIDMEGITQARSVYQQGSTIVISGDPKGGVVKVGGKVDASSTKYTGGNIDITGYNILLTDTANINASGDLGGGNINIGGNAHGTGPLLNANAVVMAPGAQIIADALTSGNGGNVVLWSDYFTNANGLISVRGGSNSGNGGFVETSSKNILSIGDISIDRTAASGAAGTWLLDPADLTISSGANSNVSGATPFTPTAASSVLNVTTLTTALGSGNVIVQTGLDAFAGNGDIIIANAISYSSANSLTLSAYRNISSTLSNAVINNSSTGAVILRADNTGTGTGTVSLTGTTPNVTASGGVSIYYNPTTFGTQDTIYSGGTAPTKYMLVQSLGTASDALAARSLGAISNNSSVWGQNFALAKSIDASATSTWSSGAGFSPIGNTTTNFTGKFDGLNYTISNLYISRSTQDYIGLFGFMASSGRISNLTLSSPNITGKTVVGAVFGYAGGTSSFNNLTVSGGTVTGVSTSSPYGTYTMVGGVGGLSQSSASMSNLTNSATVTGIIIVGGILGDNNNGIYTNLTNTGNVYSAGTSTGVNTNVGGVFGYSVLGSVTNSSNSGTITITNFGQNIGGIMGFENGTPLSNSYNTGNISVGLGGGVASVSNTGGLTGVLLNNVGGSANVTNSYSTGNVYVGSDASGVGGLFGAITAGTISNIYATGSVTINGIGTDIGGILGYQTGNSISNGYSIGSITVGSNGTNVGGFAGRVSTSSSVTNSYATGAINISGTQTRVGGFVGYIDVASGSVTKSLWDIGTTGVSTGYGTNTGTVTSLYGGCFGNTTCGTASNATNTTPVDLSLIASYSTSAGWSTSAGVSGSITNTASTTSTAPNYTWFIFQGGSRPILMSEYSTTITNAHQLQLVGTTLGATYSQANDIDLNPYMSNAADLWGTNRYLGATGFGFVSLTGLSAFSGTYNGNNHIINNLYIYNYNSVANSTTDKHIGLFNRLTGTIKNLGLVNVDITNINLSSNWTGAADGIDTGGIAGSNLGFISGSYVTGKIYSNIIGAVAYTGGIAGVNGFTTAGTISNSFNLANVTAVGNNSSRLGVGGIAGWNNSTDSTSLSSTYNGGNVTAGNYNGAGQLLVGGIVGVSAAGTITNTYNTGTIKVIIPPVTTANTFAIGGLIGYNSTTLSNSYNSGSVVSAPNFYAGAIVGTQSSGTYTNDYFDSLTSGLTQGIGIVSAGSSTGITSLTTSQTMQLANFSGWSISDGTTGGSFTGSTPAATTWLILAGSTRPMLRTEIYNTDTSTLMTITSAHQLQLMSTALSGSFTLGRNIDMTSAMNNTGDVWATNATLLSGNGFRPIGSYTASTYFTGTLNGNGYNVDNLYINNASDAAGLFSGLSTNAVVQNLGVTNANITGGAGGPVGIIAGVMQNNSAISSSYTSGSVTSSGANDVGGLVGVMNGTASITDSYNLASVLNSSTGAAGGIAGSMSTGTPTITRVYNSGSVNSSSYTPGGIVGNKLVGTISSSFFDSSTSGVTNGIGAQASNTGITAGCFSGSGCLSGTGNLSAVATYSGWSITNTASTSSVAPSYTWFMFEGATRPMLLSEYKTTITNAHQLQLAGAVLGGNYQVGNSVDLNNAFTNQAEVWGTNRNTASGSGFSSIGVNSSFSGTFNGNNNAINNLYLVGATDVASGLFATTSTNAYLANINITNAYLSVNNTNSTYGHASGILVANNSGIINNSDVSGTISAGSANYFTGGLVGYNYAAGFIINSISNANVLTGTGSYYTGGFAGANTGYINTSYSAGSVSSNASTYVGGFIGSSAGRVSNFYTTTAVTANASTNVGSAFGAINGGSFTNSYASGYINANSATNVGGYVGLMSAGTITGSLWDVVTTNSRTAGAGSNTGGTLTGLYAGCFANGGTCATQTITNATTTGSITPKDLSVLATYNAGGPSWSITSTSTSGMTTPSNTWFIYAGSTRPMLMMEYSRNITNAHQLQLMGSTAGATYNLQNDLDLTSAFNNASEIWGTNRETLTGRGWFAADTQSGFTFDGNNHIINNSYAYDTTSNTVHISGLFATVNSSYLRNINLTNVSITHISNDAVANGFDANVAGVVANASLSYLYNITLSGNVYQSSNANWADVGGITGYNFGSTYNSVYNYANVTSIPGSLGNAARNNAGGIAGEVYTTSTTPLIAFAYNAGNITGGYVSGTGRVTVGGIAGGIDASNSIYYSYNTGNITGVGAAPSANNNYAVGGIAGTSYDIQNSYNSGVITVPSGTYYAGAIVGRYFSAATTTNYFDSSLSGVASASATGNSSGSGLTTAQMQQTANFSGWSISSSTFTGGLKPAWFLIAGSTRPMSMTENSTTITNAHQLQMMSAGIGLTYILGANIDFSSVLMNTSDVWATNTRYGQGNGFVPVGTSTNTTTPAGTEFYGTLNGQDYAINNLFINNTATGNTGLFGAIANNAAIGNLLLSNVNITGTANVGGLVGFANASSGNTSNISNISVNGAIVGGTSSTSSIGGIVGWADETGTLYLRNSYNTASIFENASTTAYTGGLIGQMQNTRIVNSYNSGAIASDSTYGGLVGYTQVGSGVTSITNSFWDVSTSGVGAGYGGTAGSFTNNGIYGGCFGSTSCGTITNATNAGAAAKNLALIATYTTSLGTGAWSMTATPSATNTSPNYSWILFNNMRPMLTSEQQTTVSNAHQLQMMGSVLGANYSLQNNIDLSSSLNNLSEVWNTKSSTTSGAGFIPVGNRVAGQYFTGSLYGNGFNIDNLYIYNTAYSTDIGLFGSIGSAAALQKFGVTNASIYSSVANNYAGIIAGSMTGNATLSEVYTSGSISNAYDVGGIVGSMQGGILSDAYNIASVLDNSATAGAAGGIVGSLNAGYPIVTRVYDSGAVASNRGSNTGGIAGLFSNGSVTNSYYDSNTSGITSGTGTAGCFSGSGCSAGTANLSSAATYSGWSITSTASASGIQPGAMWYVFSGATRPMLSMENTLTVTNGHQLQMMGARLGGYYKLGNNIDLSSGMTNAAEVWGTKSSTLTGAGFYSIGNNGAIESTHNVVNGAEFTGTLNGYGYSINNLYQYTPSATIATGLFGTISGNSSITNLSLLNSNITGKAVLGSLVGNIIGTGIISISNIYASGSISSVAVGTYNAIGGLIGITNGSGKLSVQNSYSNVNVTASTSTNIGGFVGFTQGGTVSYTNDYSTGSVTPNGGTTIGGFVGYALNGVTITNSFWDTVLSGQAAGYTTTASPTISGLYGGCFGGSCSIQPNASSSNNGAAVDLSLLATYTARGWTAGSIITGTRSTTTTVPTSTWFIFDGLTRPMLASEFSTSISNLHQLQLMGSTLGGNYTLSNNLDFSTTTNKGDVWNTNFSTSSGNGFISVGGYDTSTSTPANYFTGNFNGNGYTINGLYINASTNQRNFLGLFGATNGATVRNLGLTNESIVANNATSGNGYVGGVVGAMMNHSTLYKVYTTGSIAGGITQTVNMTGLTGSNDVGDFVGGLVGIANGASGLSGYILNSYSAASVSGKRIIGGLVGNAYSYFNILNSEFTGTVSAAANNSTSLGGVVGALESTTATVSSSFFNGTITTGAYTGTSGIGGITGWSLGAVNNSYAAGLITSSAGSAGGVGGLIGTQASGAAGVTNSYSTVYINNSAGSTNGGLIGANSASVTNSFWNTDMSGQATSSGSTGAAGYRGMTNAQMMTAANYTASANGFVTSNNAWDTSNVWGIIDGQSYPYLRSFYSTAPQVISGTSGAAANSNISLAINGVATYTIKTGASGNFYGLFGNNLVTNSSYITNGALMTIYQSGSNTLGNIITIMPNNNGGLSGTSAIALTANTVNAGSAANSISLSNSQLKTAYVSGESAMLYSVDASNNLTVNSGNNFVSPATTTYTIDGNMNIVNGTLTMSGPVSITAANPTLTISGTSSISGNISGNGFTKAGSSTLTLSGTNTFTGNVNINAGTLSFSADTNLGNASNAIAINNSVLLFTGGTGSSSRAISIGAGGGTISTNTAGTLSLAGNINNNGNALTFNSTNGDIYTSGVISGGGLLTASMSNINITTLTLAGTNTYSGGTAISSGVVSVTNASGMGGATAGAVTVSSGAELDINLGGATLLNPTSSTITINGAGNIFSTGRGAIYMAGAAGVTDTIQTPIILGSASRVNNGDGNLTFASTATINNAGFLLTFGSATGLGNFNLNGVVSGAGGLAVNLGGPTSVLTLAGVNTYTGATTISNGFVSLSADSGLGAAPGVATPGQLTFNTNSPGLIATSSFTLNANRGIAFSVTPTIDVSAGVTLAYGGIAAGSGGFIKTDSGTLTLSGLNTYTGTTTISGGTLSVSNIANGGISSALGATAAATAIAINGGGILSYNGGTGAMDRQFSISGSGGTIQATAAGTMTLSGAIANGGTSLTLDTNTGNITASGVISGAGNLIKSSSGTLTLANAANTYTGSTSITGGTLSFGTIANGGSNSSLGATAAATAINISGGGILSYTGGTGSTNRQFATSGTGGTIQATAAGTLTLSGAIANAGTSLTFDTNTGNIVSSGVISGAGNVVKSSSGTLTLSGVNTYTGSTTMNAGTLSIGADSALGQAPSSVTTNDLVLNAGTLINTSSFALDANRGITIGASGVTLQTNSDLSYSGIIAGTGTLTKTSSGTLTLSGANTYSGATTISSGTVSISADNSLGAAPGSVTAAQLTINGGTLTMTSAMTINSNRGITLGASGGTFNANAAVTYGGIITGSGALTSGGSNVLTLSGVNTYTGGTTINAGTIKMMNANAISNGTATVNSGGTLQLGANFGTPFTNNVTLNSGTLSDNNANGTNSYSGTITTSGTSSINVASAINDVFTISGLIAGSGTLNKTGLGSLKLSTANTFSGAWDINTNGGIVNLANNAGLGTSAVTATVRTGGTLQLSASGMNIVNALTLSGGSLLSSASNTTNVVSGNIAVSDNSNISVSGVSNAILSLQGAISGSSGLTKLGVGNLALAGSGTYSGTVTVQTGTLELDSSSAIGTAAINMRSSSSGLIINGTNLTLANNITLNSDANASGVGTISITGSGNTLSGALALNGVTNTITTNNASDALTVSGAVTDAASNSLVKAGAGTLTISNANAYAGTTTINGGSLSIGNATALGTNAITVNSGATLALASALGANVTNAITLNSATLSSSGNNTLASGSLALTGSNNITANSGTLTINEVVSGGSVNANGAGTVQFNQSNTYSGGTTLTSGSLVANNITNPFGTGALTINGGNLSTLVNVTLSNAVVGGNASIAGGGNLTLSNATLNNGTILTITNTGTTDFTTALNGSGGITINNSSGSANFSGNNGSYSGNIVLSGGTLAVNNNNVSPLGTGTLTLGGGTFLALVPVTNSIANNFAVTGNTILGGSNNMTFSGTGTLATGTTLTHNNTASTTFSGTVTGVGNVTVNNGTLTFGGNNTGFSAVDSYSGLTTINNGGTFSVTNANALGYSSVLAQGGSSSSVAGSAISGGIFNINGVNITTGNSVTLSNGVLQATGTSSFNGSVSLVSSSTAIYNILQANGNFTMNSNVNSVTPGNGNLRTEGSGHWYMNGEIGNTSALGGSVSNVATTFGGTDTHTYGDQSYYLPITMINDVGFYSQNGSVMVYTTIDGNHPLVMNAGGQVFVQYDIGQNAPVTSLNLTSGSGITLNSGNIASTGDQTYTGQVLLNTNTNLSSSGNIVFNDYINSNNPVNLNINTTGQVSFNNGFSSNINVTINGVSYHMPITPSAISTPTSTSVADTPITQINTNYFSVASAIQAISLRNDALYEIIPASTNAAITNNTLPQANTLWQLMQTDLPTISEPVFLPLNKTKPMINDLLKPMNYRLESTGITENSAPLFRFNECNKSSPGCSTHLN